MSRQQVTIHTGTVPELEHSLHSVQHLYDFQHVVCQLKAVNQSNIALPHFRNPRILQRKYYCGQKFL